MEKSRQHHIQRLYRMRAWRKLLCSYLIVVLFLIAFTGIGFSLVIKQQRNSYSDEYAAYAEGAKERLEMILENTRSRAQQVMNNINIWSVANMEPGAVNEHYSQIQSVYATLQDYNREPAARSSFLYFPRSDYMLSPVGGGYSSQHRYTIKRYLGMEESDWGKLVAYAEDGLYFFQQEEEPSVAVLKVSLPSEQDSRAVALMHVDLSAYQDFLENRFAYYASVWMLQDSQGGFWGMTMKEETDDQFLCSYDLPQWGIRFCMMAKVEDLMRDNYQMQYLAYLFLSLGLVLGIPASYFMAYNNYKPVQAMVQGLSAPNGDRSTEYQLIENELKKISTAQRLVQEYHLENTALTQQIHLLSAMYTGKNATIESTSSQQTYCLLTMGFDAVMDNGQQNYDDILLQSFETSKRILKESGIQYESFIWDDRLILFVELPQDRELEQICLQITDYCLSYLETVCFFLESQFHQASELQQAYYEIMELLQYRTFFCVNDRYLRYSSAGKEIYNYSIYPEKEIQLLRQQVLAGSDEVAHQFTMIVERIRANRQLAMIAKKHYLAYVCACALLDEKESDWAVLYNKACQCESYISMRKLLLSSVSTIQTDKRDRLIEKAVAYIHLNYHDALLTVEQVADECGVSTAHLQRRFKSVMNQTPSVYIQEKRVQEACVLLETTDLTISTIAEKTGFTSDLTFIRSFKKIKQETPGRYRGLYR